MDRDKKKVAVNSFRNTCHFNLKLLKTCFSYCRTKRTQAKGEVNIKVRYEWKDEFKANCQWRLE